MSFNYKSYAKNLQDLLRNPNNWLTGEKENLIKLNLVILEHNDIYAKLSTEQKATVDSSFSKCPGQLNEIRGINDADRLLFAVFGYMHPMNPHNKVEMLRQCVERKLEAMSKFNIAPTNDPLLGLGYRGPSFPAGLGSSGAPPAGLGSSGAPPGLGNRSPSPPAGLGFRSFLPFGLGNRRAPSADAAARAAADAAARAAADAAARAAADAAARAAADAAARASADAAARAAADAAARAAADAAARAAAGAGAGAEAGACVTRFPAVYNALLNNNAYDENTLNKTSNLVGLGIDVTNNTLLGISLNQIIAACHPDRNQSDSNIGTVTRRVMKIREIIREITSTQKYLKYKNKYLKLKNNF